MKTLGGVLREARLTKGLSLRDIEKLSDNTISNMHVHNVEERGFTPSPKKLRVLAKVLRLNFLELMILAGHVQKTDLVVEVNK